MADPLTPEPTTDSGCHVVRLHRPGLHARLEAECPSVDPDALEAIKEAGAPWRDARYIGKRVLAVARQHNLTGVALVYGFWRDKPLPTPPPIVVPFEPIPLDEGHPALPPLIADGALPRREGTESPKPSLWRRVSTRNAFLISFAGPLLAQAAIWSALRPGLSFTYFMGGAGLLSAAIALLLQWWLFAQFFIIPGGVVVRRAVFRGRGVTLRRYDRSDSVLIITPERRIWHAVLVGARHRDRTLLTPYEGTALLAAWQSPLKPPPIEQLSDLRDSAQ
jgi:hypothetical protein